MRRHGRGRARAWLALGLVAAACGGGRSGGSSTSPPPVPVADRGPPLALVVAALDGGEIDLASHRGQVVVVHVFTTWSLAAQSELDALSIADADPEVVVIGLALDAEGRQLVAPWRAGAGVRYLIALADDAIRHGASGLGRLPAVPITIVLDRRGRVYTRVDETLGPGQLDAIVTAARAE